MTCESRIVALFSLADAPFAFFDARPPITADIPARDALSGRHPPHERERLLGTTIGIACRDVIGIAG